MKQEKNPNHELDLELIEKYEFLSNNEVKLADKKFLSNEKVKGCAEIVSGLFKMSADDSFGTIQKSAQ